MNTRRQTEFMAFYEKILFECVKDGCLYEEDGHKQIYEGMCI